MRWITIFAVSGFSALSLMMAPPGSPPVVIDALTDPVTVATGTGWAVHPDQTAGGNARLVEGPLVPPNGRGSLELSVAATTDLAITFAVPNAGALSPWSDLSGSFSTFTHATTNVAANLPTLRFQGFQSLTPVPTAFTTLSFVGGGANGEALAGEWQTWVLDADAIVFQSNAVSGFCIQSAPCTLAEFAAEYPAGGWGLVQTGIGTGAPAGARGFVDAVVVLDGVDEEFAYDFEIPAAERSTAVVEVGDLSETDGEAIVTLNASALAADSVLFTITLTLPDGSTQTSTSELAAGESAALPFTVPLGTTISVTAQDVELASAEVAPPPPPPVDPDTPAPPPSSPQLAASGADLSLLWVGLGVAGVGAILVTWAAARRARRNTAAQG